MKPLLSALNDIPEYRSLLAAIDNGSCPAAFSGLSAVHRAHFAAGIRQELNRPVVVVCADEGEAERMARDLAALSGEAVRDLAQTFQVPPERIVVLYDDISLPSGRLRVRRSGSAGGHNGIKNIIYQLSSDQFPRVKIGVGAPQKGEEDLKDFVLDTVDSDAYEGIKRAPEAALTLIFQGVDAAMQAFNGAPPAPTE